MNNATSTLVSELVGGETLLSREGGRTVIIGEVSLSSAMPGMVSAETDFGTLYLDPEEEVFVEN